MLYEVITRTITITADKILEGTVVGDSIAVNGACLTVTGSYNFV